MDKKQRRFSQIRLLMWAIVSVAFIVLVWTIGPFIAIAGHNLLASPLARAIPTIVILFAWIIYFIYKKMVNMTKLPRIDMENLPQEIKIRINQLESLFRTTKKYLKKNPSSRRFHLSRPWIYVLGTKDAGKSSLLNQAGLNLTSPISHISQITNQAVNYLNWWVSPRVVFFEINSDQLGLNEQTNSSVLWQKILAFSKKYHHRFPVDHLLIMIKASSLLLPAEKETQYLFSTLNKQIQSLKTINRRLQVSIVITQCDQVNGFIEFFNDMDPKEREQFLGIEVDGKANEKLVEQMNMLIKRISERLVWRLHHEKSLKKRTYIKDFPAGLEIISEQFKKLIKTFSWNQAMVLNGIYFSSSRLPNRDQNLMGHLLAKQFHFNPATYEIQLNHQKSFFIKRLIQQFSKQNKFPAIIADKRFISRTLALPISAAGIIAITLFWHHSYQQNLKIINEVKSSLLTIAETEKPEKLSQLKKLEIIDQTLNKTKAEDFFLYRITGLSSGHQVRQSLQTFYNQALKTSFQPFIENTIIDAIKQGMQKNLLQLYRALRAYLQLTVPAHYNQQAVYQWFMLNWRDQLPNQPEAQKTLLQQLNNLFKLNDIKWKQDKNLIKQARIALKKLTPAQLALLEFSDQYENKNVAIAPTTIKTKNLDLSIAQVPAFYSTDNFKVIYNKSIQEIEKKLATGNWVLATKKGIKLTSKQKDKLATTLRKLYLRSYLNQWQAAAQNIVLVPPTNLAEVMQTIQALTNKKSDLMQLLKNIIDNTTFPTQMGKPVVLTNKNFIELTNFVKEIGNYKKIHMALSNLNNYLHKLKTANNDKQASYLATRSRFINNGTNNDPISELLTISKKSKTPVSRWLNTIADNTWQILLDNSRYYLNTLWRNQIYIPYRRDIKNHYPIFQSKYREISRQNFKQFFGPSGNVQNFFENYLQPFVNISGNYWTWKKIDGKTIGISQNTLDMLLRASLIQQMFFTDDQNQASFKFNLIPTALSANLNSFLLNLGGQIVRVTPGEQAIKQLNWPGPKPNLVSIHFMKKDGKSISTTFTGPWALFRLLDQSIVQPSGNAKQFQLTIGENTNKVAFQLYAANLINPFLPGILNQFRFPQSLLQNNEGTIG